MRKLAQWKLQRGAPLLPLEQLIGSTTFFGAMATQWTLRTVNLLGLSLSVLWVFSPLGAQAALRMSVADFVPQSTVVDLSYFDMNAYAHSTTTSSWTEENGQADQMFLASILASNATANSKTDIWGNLKVPYLGTLQQQITANASGWRETTGQSTMVYASHIGIPVHGVGLGNTTLVIETSYQDIECLNLSNITSPDWMEWYQYFFFQDASNTTHIPGSSNHSAFKFGSYNFDWRGSTVADCYVRQKFVEAAVTCVSTGVSQARCSVTAIRPSPSNNESSSSNIFTQPDLFRAFTKSLAASFPVGHPLYPRMLEKYLIDPGNAIQPYFPQTLQLYDVPVDTFSQRFMQAVNSFYTARLAFDLLIQGGSGGTSHLMGVSGVGTVVQSKLTCLVHWGWLVVFLISTLILVAASITTFCIASRIFNPDVLGYVSTLTRDNSHIDVPESSSAWDGFERAKALGGLSIRLGDVRGNDPASGELAVGTLVGTTRTISGRHYR
ncbi:hypothetical protein BDW59DRAFT_157447 [Aspergillus cavernicola]|uniref:Uncharacterized protein n=1 Tax=Aspergillus cavernicola TaxID=176166 RepID=A0ABR4IXY0_9EURO